LFVTALLYLVVWDAIGKRKTWAATTAIVLGVLSFLSTVTKPSAFSLAVVVAVVLLAIKVRSADAA
jgi:hypothetical protein